MTAPGQAGPNTTNAGALVTFDVPGATITSPAAVHSQRKCVRHLQVKS